MYREYNTYIIHYNPGTNNTDSCFIKICVHCKTLKNPYKAMLIMVINDTSIILYRCQIDSASTLIKTVSIHNWIFHFSSGYTV